MNKRWKSAVRCVETILANFAVVGLGIAAFEQKIWPSVAFAGCAAIVAIIIAWMVPHD